MVWLDLAWLGWLSGLAWHTGSLNFSKVNERDSGGGDGNNPSVGGGLRAGVPPDIHQKLFSAHRTIDGEVDRR